MKKTDVLIVGGGVAGLGCAHELTRSGFKDFLLISKDIGGRAPDSAKVPPRVTFYARTEYVDLKPYLHLGRKADVMQGRLIGRDKTWRPISIFLKHPIAGIKFYFLLRRFYKHYKNFVERIHTVSQKTAFEEDSYLLTIFKKPAVVYLQEKGLSALQEELIGTLVRVTESIKIQDANAFLMFWTWLILVTNGRECTIDFKKLTGPFSDNVLIDEVVSISKSNNGWDVKTRSGELYACKYLVVATPINVTRDLLNIDLPEQKMTAVYSALVRGKPWPKYAEGRYDVLPSNKRDLVVVRNDDGTFMFFSTQEHYDLSKYFEEFEILQTKNWNPAAFFSNTLIEARQPDHVYLVGDYHFPGLEDSFATGIQAARSIVGEK